MPFGFFKTRKRSNSKSPRLSPGTRKKKRMSNAATLVQKRFRKTLENNFEICGLCHEHMIDKSKQQKLPCGHIFHKKCVEKLTNYHIYNCPLCRQRINPVNPVAPADVDPVVFLESLRREVEATWSMWNRLRDRETSASILYDRALARNARTSIRAITGAITGSRAISGARELEEAAEYLRTTTEAAEAAHPEYITAQENYDTYYRRLYGV